MTSVNPGPSYQSTQNTQAIDTGFNGTYRVLTQNDSGFPLTWLENNIACSATYNSDGTVATIAKNNIIRTYTYTAGVLTGVV